MPIGSNYSHGITITLDTSIIRAHWRMMWSVKSHGDVGLNGQTHRKSSDTLKKSFWLPRRPLLRSVSRERKAFTSLTTLTSFSVLSIRVNSVRLQTSLLYSVELVNTIRGVCFSWISDEGASLLKRPSQIRYIHWKLFIRFTFVPNEICHINASVLQMTPYLPSMA